MKRRSVPVVLGLSLRTSCYSSYNVIRNKVYYSTPATPNAVKGAPPVANKEKAQFTNAHENDSEVKSYAKKTRKSMDEKLSLDEMGLIMREAFYGPTKQKYDNSILVQDMPLYRGFPIPYPKTRDQPQQNYGNIEVTTIQNGCTVATTGDVNAPIGHVSLYVKNAGTRYETEDTLGYSHFLKHMIFTRTLNRSPVRVVRTLEYAAHQYTSTVAREHMCFSAGTVTHNIPLVIPLFLDSMRPKLREYILRDATEFIDAETKEALNDAHTILLEALHRTAFRSTGLGNSLFCTLHNADHIITAPMQPLEAFIMKHYQPENLVIAGSGLSHKLLTEFAQLSFADIDRKSGPGREDFQLPAVPSTPKSRYVGGEFALPTAHNSHVIFGFEGVSENDKDLYALQLFTTLLGGGKKYSADGPGGKGANSVLYREFIGNEKSDHVNTVNAFNYAYSDAGLWGVHVEAERGNVAETTKRLQEVLQKATSNIGEEDLERAKRRTQAALFRSVESQSGYVEFMAQQVLRGSTSGLQNPLEAAANYQNITADQVRKVAQRVLSSVPTVVACGDIVNLPSVFEVQAAVKQK